MKRYGADAGSDERILTTHVGSLIRPAELIAFHLKMLNGERYDSAAFEGALKHAVRDVVKEQVDAGIDFVSDGEFGKNISWSRYVIERLSGFEERPGTVGPIKATAGKDRRDFAEFMPSTRLKRASSAWASPLLKPGLSTLPHQSSISAKPRSTET